MTNIKFPAHDEMFHFFYEISKIPRGSGNTQKIADYLVSFATERGLPVYRDSFNNVLIKKAATIGYEGHPAVILQGHTDMVAEHTSDYNIDMSTTSITLICDGDNIYADKTTLGGDDGIAVAYILAILDSSNIAHPPIEALFTSDEEIGLIGAMGFNTDLLSGKTLINIDSEEEGYFTVGCAGGARADFTPVGLVAYKTESSLYSLTVSGLLGGHSGVEIDKGRANAAAVMAKLLSAVPGIKLSSIVGGSMDNAIMRECICRFSCKLAFGELFEKIQKVFENIKANYSETDKEISFTLTELASLPCSLYSMRDSTEILKLIEALPYGVLKMSEDISGLPETSSNIGIIKVLAGGECRITASIRSSVAEEKEKLKERLREIAKETDFTVEFRGEYPAWEYRKDSQLRQTAIEVYQELYNTHPSVLTIHAGLECGIFANKIPQLDCISIGPDIYNIHTTEETLSISSAIRVYDFVLALLKKL